MLCARPMRGRIAPNCPLPGEKSSARATLMPAAQGLRPVGPAEAGHYVRIWRIRDPVFRSRPLAPVAHSCSCARFHRRSRVGSPCTTPCVRPFLAVAALTSARNGRRHGPTSLAALFAPTPASSPSSQERNSAVRTARARGAAARARGARCRDALLTGPAHRIHGD